MKLQPVGSNILPVEVTNISPHGIWLLTDNREFFLSYQDFPWFKDANVREITHVEQLHPGHFYWPGLDVDLSLETIEHPSRFPLVEQNFQN